MTEATKALVARRLRQRMPINTPDADETLSNAEAAKYLGVSIKTLGRLEYPNDADGPVSFRYSEGGNVHWSKRELEAYKTRKRIRTETNLMDGLKKRSLLTDLTDF